MRMQFKKNFDKQDVRAKVFECIADRGDELSFNEIKRMVSYLEECTEDYLLNLIDFCQIELAGGMPSDRTPFNIRGWKVFVADRLWQDIQYLDELGGQPQVKVLDPSQFMNLSVPHSEFLKQYKALEERCELAPA